MSALFHIQKVDGPFLRFMSDIYLMNYLFDRTVQMVLHNSSALKLARAYKFVPNVSESVANFLRGGNV